MVVVPVDMDPERFDALVDEALDAIPDEIAVLVRNVVVLVEDEPPVDEPDDLLGLYDGVALTERGETWLPELPDRIFLFRGPLLDMCDDEDGPGRRDPDHRGARGRPPLRDRRRPAARAGLRLGFRGSSLRSSHLNHRQ